MSNEKEGIILLVDDNQDNLTLMKILLEVYIKDLEKEIGQKLKIITASSGIQALEIIENNQQEIRLVATDYTMRELDGVELIFRTIDHFWTENMAFAIITNVSGRVTESDAHCIPNAPDSMTDVIPVGGKGSAGYLLLADHLIKAWRSRHNVQNWYEENVKNPKPNGGNGE